MANKLFYFLQKKDNIKKVNLNTPNVIMLHGGIIEFYGANTIILRANLQRKYSQQTPSRRASLTITQYSVTNGSFE